MNEALHKDEGKLAIHNILAMPGIDDVVRVGMYGAQKYGNQWNYRKGMPWTKLIGSCARHLTAFTRGEDLDPESGQPHLAHLAYDCLMLLEYMRFNHDQDDRNTGVSRLTPLIPR